MALDAERARLQEAPHGRAPWRHWGPYVSERAWGTVREDYSADGSAWDYFPHDHARSRAYRWNEDGLAGICDDRQYLCLALAFWNGQDPILKERLFGLTGPQGNHGEDCKEYWWYLDSTPTHSWMRWRYVYPQAAFPYEQLVAENARRSRQEPEYELLDTGIFDGNRYWEITADYAKAGPEDILVRLTVRNAGPEEATLEVLPTLWFRNTWSWGADDRKPSLTLADSHIQTQHWSLEQRMLSWDGRPDALFCENESNAARLWPGAGGTAYPKDGIGDHIIHGAATVNPEHHGTKASLRYRFTVAPGATAQIRLRLADRDPGLGADFEQIMAQRAQEADAFYAVLTPEGTSPESAMVMRQAFAGMLWSKQFYHYAVLRWLEGDPAYPKPPEARWKGRNHDWQHLNNADVLSMPDTWEYPWYAAWDLAFHCIALAHVDPEFAKTQLTFMCREWYMQPNGQLPAYEWAFGDVNPPVHAYAALRVFEIDGHKDFDFLERTFHKLLLNFTWWINRKDAEGNNVFQGGFLGLDNIGPFDRSEALPVDGVLEQSDGTAWMAMYCLNMLELALIMARHDHAYEDIATKFFEHFTLIALAMNDQGLWDEEDGFYYDVLRYADGRQTPMRARSILGLIPLFAVTVLDADMLVRLPDFAQRFEWYSQNIPRSQQILEHIVIPGEGERRLLSIVGHDRLRRILSRMLDEGEFLSPYGVRSLSRYHLDHPFVVTLGDTVRQLDYEPAESTAQLFGGNSNWRGPVWFPINYLIMAGLHRFYHYFGDAFSIECPTGSGVAMDLLGVADHLGERLHALFLDDHGRRPIFGGIDRFQNDPSWHDLLLFSEYFHGDNGAGLGASHQTGWTGLVADLIVGRGRFVLLPPKPDGEGNDRAGSR
ncbi:MAG: MGH1-like glycoside hydrolase domain-containing protein [Chloroflexota bacterium]